MLEVFLFGLRLSGDFEQAPLLYEVRSELLLQIEFRTDSIAGRCNGIRGDRAVR